MIQIEDLLLPSPELRSYGAQPEMDPLTEDDALQEAQLLDIRFDALRLTVAFLFELRMALQLRETNTGVLVARGVRQLAWQGPARSTERTAWTVGGSKVRNVDGLFGLTLGLWPSPGAQLNLVAESAMFFAGDVPGLDESPRTTVTTTRRHCEPAWRLGVHPSSRCTPSLTLLPGVDEIYPAPPVRAGRTHRPRRQRQ